MRGFVGQDAKVARVLDVLGLVADSDATVLILGESGTGKELIARAVHENSARREGPFVPVNCGAVVESLQEAEFFGHVAGAFTGANQSRVGRLEAANGGTLFLDEICDMKSSLQGQLLRVLQSGEYTPVGVSTPRSCNIRVVAASKVDLEVLVREGSFREDLYYRLNVICVDLPPLRERRGDIALLVRHFVDLFGEHYAKPGLAVHEEVMKTLMAHAFPGNVRELENTVRRCVLLCRGPVITRETLPQRLLERPRAQEEMAAQDFHRCKTRAIESFERAFLTAALRDCGGIVSRAAQLVGLSERNFHQKLRHYSLSSASFRAGAQSPSSEHSSAE